jgi:predicted HicB family RNase H-like nuclease
MMTYKGYIGRVEFDSDAKILHGEVLGLRDVITFEGESVEEVIQAFRDSVDDYLEFCESRNEPPERMCSGQFTLRLDPMLHRAIVAIAQAHRVSINAWVRGTITEKVNREVPDLLESRFSSEVELDVPDDMPWASRCQQ